MLISPRRQKTHRSKKILAWLGLLVILSSILGLVYAYFTGTSVSQALSLQTANLAIAVADPVKDSNQPLLPGETQTATWEIKNTGNVPIHFKLKLTKSLVEGGALDSLQITNLSYDASGQWSDWVSDANLINQEVFWSDHGDNANLKTLSPGEAVKLKISFKLAADTPDELQNKSWQIKLHAAAKQISPSADWPASY